jgi:dihydrofolate synthase/folylpolyglutamate synthase
MDDSQAYEDALEYLYSYIDFSLTHSDRYSPERFHLGRVHQLMGALGNPEADYPIIHVAGTKGKGSVCALCASALQAGGYRVGLYTSPHGNEFTERIQINWVEISPDELVALINETKAIIESIPELTTFEIATALAFLYFSRQGVNAAVIEVGLGGRLDATNIVQPAVAVITSISYDHTVFLGESLPEIAREKAGIIKPQVPVVLAPQQDAARLTIERIAKERGSPVIQVGKHYLFAPFSSSLSGQSLLVWSAAEQPLVDAYIESGGGVEEWEPLRLRVPLLGAHQVENAATAYSALVVARNRGLPITEAAIRQGFADVIWPGRFELLSRVPPLVIDSAHNRDSALKLRLAIDDYFPSLPVILVFGASQDKDIQGMFKELLPRVRQVIATRSIHPRSIDPDILVDLAHQFGSPARAVPTVEEALEEALRLAESEAVIVVTGSLFVAAGVRAAWLERYGGKVGTGVANIEG